MMLELPVYPTMDLGKQDKASLNLSSLLELH
jgi:hypothetical protein